MSAPAPGEWLHLIDLRQVPQGAYEVTADADARRRLSARFGLSAIDRLVATVLFEPEGARVTVTGRIAADVVQPCAISGEDFPVAIDEPVWLRFVPTHGATVVDEEIELSAEACDEIEYAGTAFDLGEALAQTLALAIDPFAQGPDAERARAEHGLAGEAGGGAFAALAGLKTQD